MHGLSFPASAPSPASGPQCPTHLLSQGFCGQMSPLPPSICCTPGGGGWAGTGTPVSLLLHQPWESRPPHLQPSLGLSLRPAVPCVWPGGWCTYNPTTQWPMTTQAGIYSENLSPNNRCPQSKKETWWGLGKKPKGSTATSRGHLCQRQGESLNWRGAHMQVPNVNIYLEPCKKPPCHARPVFLH